MAYIYKNVVLKPRITNWSKYRIPSIEFKDKYKKFKEQYIDASLEKELQSKIMSNKDLAALALASNNKDDVSSKLKLSEKLFDDYPELLVKYTLQNIDEIEVKERFLIDNDMENVKVLFEFLYENSTELDYNINTEEEYSEFYALASSIFDDFFTKPQLKKQN